MRRHGVERPTGQGSFPSSLRSSPMTAFAVGRPSTQTNYEVIDCGGGIGNATYAMRWPRHSSWREKERGQLDLKCNQPGKCVNTHVTVD